MIQEAAAASPAVVIVFEVLEAAGNDLRARLPHIRKRCRRCAVRGRRIDNRK
jgi:hypothetical protein